MAKRKNDKPTPEPVANPPAAEPTASVGPPPPPDPVMVPAPDLVDAPAEPGPPPGDPTVPAVDTTEAVPTTPELSELDKALAELERIRQENETIRHASEIVLQENKTLKKLVNQDKTNKKLLAQSSKEMKEAFEKADRDKKTSDASKKHAEQLQAAHLKLEEDLRTGQQSLPFDDPDEGDTLATAAEGFAFEQMEDANKAKSEPDKEDPADQVATEGADAGDDPSGFKVEILAEFGLASKYIKALVKKGFLTIGAIGKWTNPIAKGGGGKLLRDIPGIRDKGQDEMIDALDAFWAKYRPQDGSKDKGEPTWEVLGLESLSLSPAIVDILDRFKWDPPLTTVGALFAFHAAGNTWSQIPGMTDKRCHMLDQAIANLMAARQAIGLPVPSEFPGEPLPAEPATTAAAESIGGDEGEVINVEFEETADPPPPSDEPTEADVIDPEWDPSDPANTFHDNEPWDEGDRDNADGSDAA